MSQNTVDMMYYQYLYYIICDVRTHDSHSSEACDFCTKNLFRQFRFGTNTYSKIKRLRQKFKEFTKGMYVTTKIFTQHIKLPSYQNFKQWFPSFKAFLSFRIFIQWFSSFETFPSFRIFKQQFLSFRTFLTWEIYHVPWLTKSSV